jgi:DNA-binding transcriptional LysR family regulator
MDWDKLRIFQAVADAGSFTHAGDGLKLSQSAISRQIGALEEQLGVMLFHRHARGLILTEQGELLYRTARDMAAKVNTAEALLRANQDKPAGRLKVTTTVGFGSTWLTAQMHEFIAMYPEVDVSLVLSDNELDLGMREADVAIRMVMPRQPGLIQRHLLTVRSHVYAAHTYIEKYGRPTSLEDLDNHRLIIFGEDARSCRTSTGCSAKAAANWHHVPSCSASTTSTASSEPSNRGWASRRCRITWRASLPSWSSSFPI